MKALETYAIQMSNTCMAASDTSIFRELQALPHAYVSTDSLPLPLKPLTVSLALMVLTGVLLALVCPLLVGISHLYLMTHLVCMTFLASRLGFSAGALDLSPSM